MPKAVFDKFHAQLFDAVVARCREQTWASTKWLKINAAMFKPDGDGRAYKRPITEHLSELCNAEYLETEGSGQRFRPTAKGVRAVALWKQNGGKEPTHAELTAAELDLEEDDLGDEEAPAATKPLEPATVAQPEAKGEDEARRVRAASDGMTITPSALVDDDDLEDEDEELSPPAKIAPKDDGPLTTDDIKKNVLTFDRSTNLAKAAERKAAQAKRGGPTSNER